MLKTAAAILLFLCQVAVAQPFPTIIERGKDHFETQFSPGKRLKLEIRSSGVRVVGTDSNQISVSYEGKKAADVSNVEVQFRPTGDGGSLKISGGPRDEFEIRIEVPRETALYVRMPFGELDLNQVRGDKNVEILAGEVNIDLGDPKDYARIEASVYTGEINSAAMAMSKGGLFRSFEKDGPGKYRLYAHVGSGELNLE
jgi:hypothetical protein